MSVILTLLLSLSLGLITTILTYDKKDGVSFRRSVFIHALIWCSVFFILFLFISTIYFFTKDLKTLTSII